MCDTNEHMLIGDQAAAWIPQMLQKLCTENTVSLDDYTKTPDDLPTTTGHSSNLFGDGDSWFTFYNSGQFRMASGVTDDWASYGDVLALSGDYYQDEGSMISDPNRTETLINAWRSSMSSGIKVKDPQNADMIRRAMSNWPHFGHDAISLWLKVHREALDIAIRGRAGKIRPDEMQDLAVRDMGLTQVQAGLILALRHNAFGDHYLSDFFSSGHLRVPRQEFFKFLGPGPKNLGQTIPASAQLLRIEGKVGRDVDIASVMSGIGHDEDGKWGLWCTPHFWSNGVTLNGIDGLVQRGSGRSHDNTNMTWLAPLSDTVTQFYARGDDGLAVTPQNDTTRALCFYTIGLSIRDILYASVTGLDPQNPAQPGTWGHTIKQPDNWYTCMGKAPDTKPLYAALALLPRPNKPDASWADRADNFAGKINHFPLLMPDIGFDAWYDAIRAHCAGSTTYTEIKKLTVRSWVRPLASGEGRTIGGMFGGVGGSAVGGLVDTVTVTGGCYSPQAQNDSQYFDFADHMTNGEGHVPAAAWLSSEETPMVARYVNYKR